MDRGAWWATVHEVIKSHTFSALVEVNHFLKHTHTNLHHGVQSFFKPVYYHQYKHPTGN